MNPLGNLAKQMCKYLEYSFKCVTWQIFKHKPWTNFISGDIPNSTIGLLDVLIKCNIFKHIAKFHYKVVNIIIKLNASV